eukprot:8765221-Karenia_brevis.AAC.1
MMLGASVTNLECQLTFYTTCPSIGRHCENFNDKRKRNKPVSYIKAPHDHDTSIIVDPLKLYTHLGGRVFLQQSKSSPGQQIVSM